MERLGDMKFSATSSRGFYFVVGALLGSFYLTARIHGVASLKLV
jgi:hypothetical protein